MTSLPTHPITPLLPEIVARLTANPCLVLEAPPGAGKTTLVPLALAEAPIFSDGKILLLEPRRLAARAAARRMASTLREKIGETVGYQVRLERKIGPGTRIEVLTEGLLTSRLKSDPALAGVRIVIFDEFHERSLDADLGLALTRTCQEILNQDLRILVMSATLDGERIAAMLCGAPVLRAEGRAFPVETRFAPLPERTPLDTWTARTIRRAIAETEGGVLVFLPGEAEIRRVEADLRTGGLPPSAFVAPLYGALDQEAQDRAVTPAPEGQRKIVLATAIAETSLTIEDVRVVVDAGLERRPAYDPGSGLTRLVTQRLSRASADQRRGRAGRLAPGICYRLWSEPENRALQPHAVPEILASDLASLVLDVAAWGLAPIEDLSFLDPPPSGARTEAQMLLRQLGALDADGRATPHGGRLADLGTHPRLAHMMVAAAERGDGPTAVAIAAILGERDILRAGGPRDRDMRTRLEIWAGDRDRPGGTQVDAGALRRAQAQAALWRRRLNIPDEAVVPASCGPVLALAYPDRVAQAQGRHGRFRLRSGRGAFLPEDDPLAGADFLVAASLDARAGDGAIFLAAPLTRTDIEDAFADAIENTESVAWDRRAGSIAAVARDRLGALVLAERPIERAAPERWRAALIEGIRDVGLDRLAWPKASAHLRARAAFARTLNEASPSPNLSDEALTINLEEWLGPFLGRERRPSDIKEETLAAALDAMLTHEMRKALDRLAPTHLSVPSGSRVELEYGSEGPRLNVRLQEVFGLTETPRIGGGKVPVTLVLLSPARRPVAVTQDLKTFWANGYRDARKELKARYPKHFWPDDPASAEATARTRPRGS